MYNVPLENIHILASFFYLDQDAIRVDLNVEVNERDEVKELSLIKYSGSEEIILLPSLDSVKIQAEF
jgi:hypothetical protein